MTYEKLKKLWAKFSDRDYRHAYLSSTIGQTLSTQIYYLRTRAEMNQYELAEAAEMKQPRISMLEKTCENVSLATLKKIAKAFDVALIVKFVPFSQVLNELDNENLDKIVTKFEKDKLPNLRATFDVGLIDQGKTWVARITSLNKAAITVPAMARPKPFISAQIAQAHNMESLNA